MANTIETILFIAIIVWVFYWAIKSQNKAVAAQQAILHQQEEDRQKRISALSTMPLVEISVSDIVVRTGEKFYWRNEHVRLIGDQHHAHYVGGSSGVSIPLGHGFRTYIGGHRGRRIDNVTQTVVDAGTLSISNKRVIFIGQKKSTEIPVSSILKATPFSDGLRIDRANKQPFIASTGSPYEAVVLNRVMTATVDQPIQQNKAELVSKYFKELDDILATAKAKKDKGEISEADFQKITEKIKSSKENENAIFSREIQG